MGTTHTISMAQNVYVGLAVSGDNWTTSNQPLATATFDNVSITSPAAPAAPVINSLSPTSGPVSSSVTVSGTSFGATQGTSTLTFNGTPASPSSWSATSILVSVPSGATTGNIVVTVSGVASNGANFTVLPTPSITSLSPNSGSVGSSITITGTNFGASPGSSTVTFNGTTASPSSWGPTSLMVPVPNGATTGNILVTVAGVASNGANFTVTTAGPPKITAAASPAPNSNGWNNSSVTVTFTCTAGSATITNCPAPQTISSQGPNQIVTGTATDVSGNVAASNFHLSLVGTLPVPNSLQISPAGVNMLLGETRQFAAVDELGRVRFD